MADSPTIDCLADCRLESFVRRDYEWVATFDQNAHLVIACLWRLLEGGRIRWTSQDDGHQFGLPAPVDAAEEITRHLCGQKVGNVILRAGTLDLELGFGTGHMLQIIPNSSGYEAWNLLIDRTQFIAVGGGDLTIFDS